MSLHYCDRWFHARKRPIDLLDEGTARARHAAHQPYTVVVGSLERPTHVISLRESMGQRRVLRRLSAEYLSYDFRETGTVPGSLFLKMADSRESGCVGALVFGSTRWVLMGASARETVPAWRGDWQERIAQRLKQRGFESYLAFLEANPGVTYTEMARLLSEGEDVVPVQLERLHASSVKTEQRELAALDSLARFLREALKKGWGVGHRWQGIVGAALTTWNVTWGGGPELEKLERALFDLKPPEGWIPEPKDDVVLRKAAAAVWQRR